MSAPAESTDLPATQDAPAPLKPGWIGICAVYAVIAAVFLRSLEIEDSGEVFYWILGGETLFILLFSVSLWKYRMPRWLMLFYFAIQSALTVALLSLWPDFDFIIVYFVLLAYQVSLVFTGGLRWTVIGVFVCVLSGSLIYYHGLLRGLALSLTNVAGSIVVPAYLIANHEIELARRYSQRLLTELQSTHAKLQIYAGEVEELTTIQERNRLARELHDTVSQLLFSISLTTRSAQLLLEKDPNRLREQIQRLQEITGEALAQLRLIITQLRPPQGS